MGDIRSSKPRFVHGNYKAGPTYIGSALVIFRRRGGKREAGWGPPETGRGAQERDCEYTGWCEDRLLIPRLLFNSSCLVAALLVLGCSKSEQRDTGCPRPQAPFRLQLTAEEGRLPSDTHIVVRYQGGAYEGGMPKHKEEYDLTHPTADNVDVCCRPGDARIGKLPSVPCGSPVPATRDASRRGVEAGPMPEAGRSFEAGADAALSGEGGALGEAGAVKTDAKAPEGGARADARASLDGGSPAAILCELWTNGPAQIVVTGAKYPELETDILSVQLDECGPVTRDVRLVWSRGDAGR
jgi:hypothetical protein